MVVGDGGSEKPPSSVVIANTGYATRLIVTAIRVEVSVGNVSTNAKTTDCIAIGVNSFYIYSVIPANLVVAVRP